MIKKILFRVSKMKPVSSRILRLGYWISCAMLVAALLLLLYAGELSLHTYKLYKTAETLFRLPALFLLFAVFGSAIAEDMAQ